MTSLANVAFVVKSQVRMHLIFLDTKVIVLFYVFSEVYNLVVDLLSFAFSF